MLPPAAITAPVGCSKLAKEQDVLVTLYHMMKFPWKRFEIRIDNDGRIVRNMQEFVGATNDFLDVEDAT